MEKFLARESARKHYYGMSRRINQWKNLRLDRLPKLLILVYHRVLPAHRFSFFDSIVTLEKFIEHLDTLTKRFPIISLTDALAQCWAGRAKTNLQAVLTFDDGYCDNYEVVFPVLKKRGVSAVFFLATDYIGGNIPLWEWEVAEILYRNMPTEGVLLHKKIWETKRSFVLRVIEEMKGMDLEKRERVISFLRIHSNNRLSSGPLKDRCLNWEEVKKMSSSGMEIGSHGMSHRALSRIPFADAIKEIEGSRKAVEKHTQKPCLHFSFPFGSQKDYNQRLIDHIKRAGFHSCLLNTHGYNHIRKDLFCFKRIIMEETTDMNFLLG